ncbi:MAG: proline--tRNA ligase, partial [Candidatus Aenigmatarchaeota archaeon]
LKENIVEVSNFKDFEAAMKRKKMIKARWCGGNACEEDIKEKTGATNRLLVPSKKLAGKCVHCGKPAKELAYFARAY